MRFNSAKARSLLAITSWAVILLLILSSGNLTNAKPEPIQEDTREVAKEILKIQQELGGSVVDLPSAELEPPGQNAWNLQANRSLKSQAEDPVSALRESSLRLELVAHRLELHDLYAQADATRELAKRLRQDARDLKSADNSEKQD